MIGKSRLIRFPISAAVALMCISTVGGCKGPVNADATQVLQSRLGHASFRVLPTIVRRKSLTHDTVSATELVEFVEHQELGTAELCYEKVQLDGSWHHNQAKMFRESASDVSDFVKEKAAEGQYWVLAECLMVSDQVLGAHLYILDSEGRVAYGILSNSHHPQFSSRSPRTVGDCVAVLIGTAEKELEQLKVKKVDSPEAIGD